jgi:uncharacterized lipoprotein YddW (UPF0748 family)
MGITMRIKYKNLRRILFLFCMIAAVIGQSACSLAATDKTAPKITYTLSTKKITSGSVKIKIKVTDSSKIKSVKWASGSHKASYFKSKGTKLTLKSSAATVTVKKNGTYTFYAKDSAGNESVKKVKITNISTDDEFRAVWISYLEFSKTGYTESAFQSYIDTMFDNCVANKMNAVIVQVRPYGDALYPSSYFPWSVYISGEQGKDPGYDPLEYMVEAAHQRGLEFHAWINPYRITTTNTKISTLSADNPARKWRASADTKRNVLTFGGSLYYNPSSTQVQKLIVNGVKEIVKNYDVDGIHFDDYFYPALGSSYETNFDATEYEAYVETCEEKGTTAKTIVKWRRANVNSLIKKVYAAIKAIDEDCDFGISPAGSISNLYASDRYYSDVKLWMKTTGYIDYICPQIYWSFKHPTAAFDTMLEDWVAAKTNSEIKLYLGLAVYRTGISKSEAASIGDPEWATSDTVLKRQVLAGRETGVVSGFVLFRYDQMIGTKAAEEMENLLSIIK